jgi:hypothetical protein
MDGDAETAGRLIGISNMPAIRDWTESIWGAKSPYLQYCATSDGLPVLPRISRIALRMPTLAEKQALHERDGYHCRFCCIPVVRSEVRRRIVAAYPNEALWGRRNSEQHAALQAMWAQYDHILPHSRGGTSELSNMAVTCAPCNFGAWNSPWKRLA